MAIAFQESEVVASQYKTLKLNDLAIGESVHFFVVDTEQRTSEEFGDFQVIVGLDVDVNAASSIKDLADNSEAASFIPNTMLQNAKLQSGCLYRIEKLWNRGDKSPNGKRAKGFGFKLFKLAIDKATTDSLFARFNGDKFVETEITPPAL